MTCQIRAFGCLHRFYAGVYFGHSKLAELRPGDITFQQLLLSLVYVALAVYDSDGDVVLC